MFTSLQKLALPLISAAAFLSLSGAQPADAATVVATAHYQSSQSLICSGQTCRGEFPAIAARRKLKLTRVTCSMRSAQYAAYATGKIDVRDSGNVSSLAHFLPADYSTDWGYHVINSATEVQVFAGRQIVVTLSLAPGGGSAYEAACTAHGTLEVLQ